MGLDMYLSVRKYISKYDWTLTSVGNEYKENQEFKIISELISPELFDPENSSGINIEIPVAYWRKANQIHNWFVSFPGRGIDECQPTNVTRRELENLLSRCKDVLKFKHVETGILVAQRLLPTTSGFFFGSTEYDDSYYEDLKYTVDRIEKLLSLTHEFDDFIYQASW